MAITVGKLHKMLGALIEQGHARKPVCVNKTSFQHPLEADGAVILDVSDAYLHWVPMTDDDGGQKMNADGTESGRNCVVISGGADD